MSTGGQRKPRVVVQHSLFGGSDVIEHFGRGSNTRHHASVGHALVDAAELAAQDKAELAMTSSPCPRLSRCPKCGVTGETLRDFGMRVVRGEPRAQSWCRSCRVQ